MLPGWFYSLCSICTNLVSKYSKMGDPFPAQIKVKCGKELGVTLLIKWPGLEAYCGRILTHFDCVKLEV
jgi:hypothetical protein